jgi:uncharacterized membrane protein YkvA (DUF1232 family)
VTDWWGVAAAPRPGLPDVIPVLGVADDVSVAALVLRFVLRRTGVVPLRRHWPGTAAGLSSLLALTGLAGPRDDRVPED